jgi:hypothetical protein
MLIRDADTRCYYATHYTSTLNAYATCKQNEDHILYVLTVKYTTMFNKHAYPLNLG